MSQTLLTSQTPGSDNNDDGTIYTMGTTWQPDVNGQVLGLRVWAPSDATGAGWTGKTLTGVLYNYDTEALLATKDASGPFTLGGWNTVVFDTPANVVAGGWYVVAKWIASNLYVATGQFFLNGPLVNGHLTGSQDGSPKLNGVFLSSPGGPQFPNQHFQGGLYFIDPIFQPAGGSPTAGVWGVSR